MTDEDAKFHWSEGMKYAAEGIKAAFLLNGVAAISVLTVLGNVRSGDDRLVYSMMLFALGALLGPIAFLFAYLAQLQYGNARHGPAKSWHFATYAAVLCGMIAFAIGIGLAGRGFLAVS